MPPEGFADPITSDWTGFHSNIPVSELIKHITRAIEARKVASTPPVAKIMDGATVTKTSRPLTESPPHVGAWGRPSQQWDQTYGRGTIVKVLSKGYV